MFTDKKDFQYYLACNPDFSLSQGSINTYVKNLDTFFNRYDEMSQENVNDYYFELKEKHQPSYTNLILNSLKHYSKFVGLDIKIPKELRKIRNDSKDVVSYEYLINDIFGSVDLGGFQNVYQVKAILSIMFYTGLRLSDYMNLHRKDFVFKKDYGYTTVFVQKNLLQKRIYFPQGAMKYIVNYFDTTEEIDNAFNLTPTTIRNLFVRLDGMVSDKHLHPHIMRGSAITHLYKQGWNVEEISKLIGISCKTIWDYYLQISMDDIESKYVSKMKGK